MYIKRRMDFNVVIRYPLTTKRFVRTTDPMSKTRRVVNNLVHDSSYPRTFDELPDLYTMNHDSYYREKSIISRMRRVGAQGITVSKPSQLRGMDLSVLRDLSITDTSSKYDEITSRSPINSVRAQVSGGFPDTSRLPILSKLSVGNYGIEDYSQFNSLRELKLNFTYGFESLTTIVNLPLSRLTVWGSNRTSALEDKDLAPIRNMNLSYLNVKGNLTGEFLQYLPKSVTVLEITYPQGGDRVFDWDNTKLIPDGSKLKTMFLDRYVYSRATYRVIDEIKKHAPGLNLIIVDGIYEATYGVSYADTPAVVSEARWIMEDAKFNY